MQSLYAAVRPNISCVYKVRNYFLEQKVPGVLDLDEFHTTIVYSNKAPVNYSQVGKVSLPTIYAFPTTMECWKTNSGKNALVLRLHCPKLVSMHEEMMHHHALSYDYEEYKPHMTISYDVGIFDWKNVHPFNFPVEFNEFYDAEVNEDWRG